MSNSIGNVTAGRIRRQAKRILSGKVVGTDRPIFPGYISFDEDQRPRWWSDEFAPGSWGALLGVHESEPGCSVGAIVVTDRGLGLLNEPRAPVWLPYETINGWNKLSKDPISKSLVVRTDAGDEVELLFPDGGAFAFVQFIGYVTEQLFRERQGGGRKR